METGFILLNQNLSQYDFKRVDNVSNKFINSTVKSDQKFRFSETISFKRFLNVILVLKVSLTNAEFFQKFGSEEVPLLATFSHFVATFTYFRISRVPNVRKGSGLNEGVCIDE